LMAEMPVFMSRKDYPAKDHGGSLSVRKN